MGEYALRSLEYNLIDFIVDNLSTLDSIDESKKYRIKSLKLILLTGIIIKYHVKVSLGIYEAEYDFKSGEKVSGSLGSDIDRIIKKWFQNPSITDILTKLFEENN